MSEMKEDNMKLEYKGSWDEVSELCEEITKIVRDSSGIEDESNDIDDWDDWIPEEGEEEQKIDERTVEHASYGEAYEEEPAGDVQKEIEKTKEEAEDITQGVGERDSKYTYKSLKATIKHFLKASKKLVINKLNKFEKFIYHKFIVRKTKYFDTELINASIQGVRNISLEEGEDEYLIKITFQDTETKEEVYEKLKERGYN